MTKSDETDFSSDNQSAVNAKLSPAGRARALVRGKFGSQDHIGKLAFSRLTITIVLTNMFSLLLLLYGSLSLTQYRDGLVQSKLEGVRAQAQIIADIMAQVTIDDNSCAVTEIDSAQISDGTRAYNEIETGEGEREQGSGITRLPKPIERIEIIELADISGPDRPAQNGQSFTGQSAAGGASCHLSLVPGDVKEVFNRVWDSFEGRVRVFNAPSFEQGPRILDASTLLLEDVVLREDRILETEIPDINTIARQKWTGKFANFLDGITSVFFFNSYRSFAEKRTIEDELNLALAASPFAEEPGAALVRINENGELVASVSVPVRRVQAIYGIVTAEIGGIDDLVSEARLAILPLFGFASAAAILSSLLLTAIIAQPIRQLAVAADKVREGIAAAGRARIPDFTRRRDEIGELSRSLKSMTQTIYERIEDIESFAADVSHELKNPLTSIRSATETLDLAKTPEAREKLMGVIKKDVARMDRLITDISNASRLDAELAREAGEAVELSRLIRDIVSLYADTAKENDAPVLFSQKLDGDGYVKGSPSALGQVVRNLVDNARSFSPDNGTVRVRLEMDHDEELYRITFDDDGPGIPPDNLESIFQRFYTQRPKGTVFGNNSGLGLAISRQIINAHGGRIWAQNILKAGGEIAGAQFTVELPMA